MKERNKNVQDLKMEIKAKNNQSTKQTKTSQTEKNPGVEKPR